jgi:hypothetical protein
VHGVGLLAGEVDHARAKDLAYRDVTGDVGRRTTGQQYAFAGVRESRHLGEVARVIAVLLVPEHDDHECLQGPGKVTSLLRYGTAECDGQVVWGTHQHSRALVAAFKMLDDPIYHPATEAAHLMRWDWQYVSRELLWRPRKAGNKVPGSPHANPPVHVPV